MPSSRFKIRDLKHFKDERTHKPFKEEQEVQHVFYDSNKAGMRMRNCSEQLALTKAQQFSGCIKPVVVAALLLHLIVL